MKFEAHIICWNESRILPYVLEYWRLAGVDRLYVHDNRSTDASRQILSQYPFVTVLAYDSAGQLDDYVLRAIKETCWHASDADWVFIGDCDEVPFVSPRRGSVKDFLQAVPDDVAVIQPCGYQLVSWTLPITGDPLHLHPDVRMLPLGPNKTNLFRPQRVRMMNYSLGAHTCEPLCDGRVEYLPAIAWLHLKNLGVEYLVTRNRELYARLPEQVKSEKRIAVHYLPGSDYRNVAADLAQMWEASGRWCDFENIR